MNFKILSTALLLVACKGDAASEPASNNQGESPPTSAKTAEPSKQGKSALPDTTQVIALNTDGHEIPASIEMPTGSTIFADEPTTLRVGFDGKDSLGRRDSLFAVQIRKGNEFNLDLAGFAKDLLKNQYGSTNEILEQSDTLLLYKSTVDEGGFTQHSFQKIIELDGEKWVCKEGNDGGWTEEQARAQLAACLTLKSI